MKYKKIRTYYTAIEASLAQDTLLRNDIPCFLTNENVTSLMPSLNFIAGGGITLMVSGENFQIADKILSDQESNDE
jgi:hypothetical protein